MVIAEGHLAIIIRTTMTGPATTLVIDRLRQAQYNGTLVFKPCFNAGHSHILGSDDNINQLSVSSECSFVFCSNICCILSMALGTGDAKINMILQDAHTFLLIY